MVSDKNVAEMHNITLLWGAIGGVDNNAGGTTLQYLYR